MTTFRITTHSVTGHDIIEILGEHGELLGCVYPHREEQAIHIVSKHFADVDPIMPSIGMLPVPGYLIRFKS